VHTLQAKDSTSKLFRYVLVTGATGLVGAHVVALLLQKGFKVRAVVRSKAKAQKMMDLHDACLDKLDFHYIDDLTSPNAFEGALKDIDGVIHLASVSTKGVEHASTKLG
jgi:uncharacterized protein YbjT (DUF2867 family)